MSLSDKIATRILKQTWLRKYMGSPSGNSEVHYSPTGSYTNQLVDRYEGIVYACIRAIAEQIASTDWKAIQQTTKGEREVSNPLVKLIEQNKKRTKYSIMDTSASYDEIFGEVFWYLPQYEGAKVPADIIPLRPDRMTVLVDKETGEVYGYKYRKNNGEVPFEVGEVEHMFSFNPNDQYRGLGTLKAGLTYIETESSASKFERNFLRNNASPSGIVKMGGAVEKEAFKQFTTQWREKYEGEENAGKTAFIRDGDVTYTKIGLNLNELDMNALKNMSQEQIMMMFRVPKSLLGLSDEAGLGRASVETLEYIFAKRVIEPKLQRWDDFLTRILHRHYPKMADIKLTHASVVPADKEYMLQYYDKAVDRWISRNEIRAESELEPLDGNDGLYIPMNMLPTSATAKPKSYGTISITKKEVAKKGFDTVAKESFRTGIMATRQTYEGRYQDETVKFLEKQRKELIDKLNPKSAMTSKSINDMLFNPRTEGELMAEILAPIILELYQEGGQAGVLLVGGETTEFIVNAETARLLKQSTQRLSNEFNQQTKDLLHKTLTEGIGEGESLHKLKSRVTSVYQEAKGYRAERIARTETLEAVNGGAMESYRQCGFEKHEWVAQPNHSDECECADYDGEIIVIGDLFTTTSYRDVEFPPLHPNCFLHHTVKVTTDKGEKNINEIKVGDKVLTHKGRYQPVTHVMQSPDRYHGKAIRITFRGRADTTKIRSACRNQVTVTPEHPFLTQRGWVMAENLTKEDKLFVKANACKTCGELVPYWKSYCGASCRATADVRRKISESKQGEKNAMWGKFGELHHLWNGGKIDYRGGDWKRIKLLARQRDNFTCQNCSMTEEQHLNKYNQPLQVHHIDPYRRTKDNTMENLVTLCCQCHCKIEHTTRKAILEYGGQRFIANKIVDVKVLENYRAEKRYNLEVKNDHSYVAKGIVTHNCECTTVPVTDED